MTLTPKALAIAGAFYFFSHHHKLLNQPSIPGTNGYLAPPRAGFLLNQCYNRSISTYPMSEEQLKAFLEAVKADAGLQEKLKAAADNDGVAAIAKDAGFSISADDLKNAQSEISEEELENVAGGACTSRLFSLPFEWAKPNSCNG